MRALPALPVSPAARILAELLPPLALALLVRWAGAELLSLWIGTRDLLLVDAGGGWVFASETLVGTSVMMPVLTAWAPRPPAEGIVILRPTIAAVLMFALLKQGSAADPALAPVLGLLLAVAFYAIPGIDAPHRAPARRPASRRERASRVRRGIDPGARLRRDLWGGSLRVIAPFAAALLLAALAVPLIDRLRRFPADQADFWYGLVIGLSLSLCGIAALYPMGVHILKTDRLAGSGALMSGAYCAAWAALPVRRESVARAVYASPLIAGAAWCLFVVGFSLLSHALASTGASWLRFFLPLALGAPALAGFLTCMAVGDRVRGTIALAALFCVLPAHIGSQLACAAAGLPGRSPVVLAVDVATMLVLGAAGGLPALIHLKRNQGAGARPREERP